MTCGKFRLFHLSPPVLRLAVVSLALMFGLATAVARADHDRNIIRWDIISLEFGSPNIIHRGGEAFAQAPNHLDPTAPLRIRLTGAGTFPARRGASNDVRGGGTWTTYDETGARTGRGKYWVTELASWEFDSYQTPGFIDTIADASTRANGNAVLRIRYSDGSRGVLLIGCHGPGASNGILEGVGASKDQVTYWGIEQPPAGQVDVGRTLFHVLPDEDEK